MARQVIIMPQMINLSYSAGDYFVVSGKTLYSRITRLSQDLEREAFSKSSHLNLTENFYTLAISDAKVRKKDDQNPTPAESYAEMKISKNGGQKKSFQEFIFDDSKPAVYMKNSVTKSYKRVELGDEIRNDVPVTIVYKFVMGDKGIKLVFDRIFIEEDLNDPIADHLARLGITIDPEA